MKVLLLGLLLPTALFAADCKVDGISDSPQHQTCYLQKGLRMEPIRLSCVDGQYKLRWEKKLLTVETAYHEEVERGPSPLVFVAGTLNFVLVSYKLYNHGELVVGDKLYHGICFDR